MGNENCPLSFQTSPVVSVTRDGPPPSDTQWLALPILGLTVVGKPYTVIEILRIFHLALPTALLSVTCNKKLSHHARHIYIRTCGFWPRDHKKTHAVLLNYDVPQVGYAQSVFNLKFVQLTMSPDHDRIYKAELHHK